MKPDWKDAPEWANWLAMDANGGWWWFELKPKYVKKYGIWIEVRGQTVSLEHHMLADGKLECRP